MKNTKIKARETIKEGGKFTEQELKELYGVP